MQKSFFQRIPVPLSGVMLSFAAFGNFIRSFSEPIWMLSEILAGILFLTLILKAVLVPDEIRRRLADPVLGGIVCTFTMGSMFFSVSLKSISYTLGETVWIAAVVLHFIFMGNYTIRFLKNPGWKNLYTVSFLVYVGIAAAAAASPAFGFERFGTVLLYFAAAAMLILFPLNIFRYLTLKSPEAFQPLICIFAAPLSLCLVAYLQTAVRKNVILVVSAVPVTVGIYVFALLQAVRIIRKGKFFPSFSAFTFPFVNTAIAAFQSSAALKKSGFSSLSALFRILAIPEMAIAVFLLIFVFASYIRALFLVPSHRKKIGTLAER